MDLLAVLTVAVLLLEFLEGFMRLTARRVAGRSHADLGRCGCRCVACSASAGACRQAYQLSQDHDALLPTWDRMLGWLVRGRSRGSARLATSALAPAAPTSGPARQRAPVDLACLRCGQRSNHF